MWDGALCAALCGQMTGRDGAIRLFRLYFHQRKAKILPLMKAAQQWPDAADSDLSELQRHTGAGGLVWSSTEKHDLAVASDLSATRL